MPQPPDVLKPVSPAAHTPGTGSEEWHDLTSHLRAVAAAARAHASKFGVPNLGYLAGLLHDLGKFADAFQDYLWEAFIASRQGTSQPLPGSVQHAIHGAAVARRLYAATFPRISASAEGAELAWVILNHHTGLQDLDTVDTRLVKAQADGELFKVVPKALPHLHELNGLRSGPPHPPQFNRAAGREFFLRMLLSALVDADFTDTEAWRDPSRSELRSGAFLSIEELAATARQNQEALIARATATPVNRARREIYDSVMKHVPAAPGFFRLTVPTGGGKTRLALLFGLEHARHHGLDRVIVAIPYTSITDQTAGEYREILGAENVLEHHSSVNAAGDEADIMSWNRLAAENWDAPIVVTTTVQLFESIFANRTSKLRKLHNLVRSVIVIDEAQTLPVRLLDPILDALSELTGPRYGTSVVLSTATQPALNEDLGFPALASMRDLLPEAPRYFKTLTRVRYATRTDAPWPWRQVAARMRSHNQVLCIVNLKAHARELFQELADDDALHLSTNMTPEHRQEALEVIRERLRRDKSCRVVTTPLVEAGVDLDFPAVLRAMGPLDSIVQAAGRCNREGRLTHNGAPDLGKVVVFRPEDHRTPPGYYATATREAEAVLANGADLNSATVFEAYFRTLYLDLVNRDAEDIQRLRHQFDYPEVARRFRMIGDDTEPVIVPNRARDRIERTLARGLNRFTLRQLQPHTINVFKSRTQHLQDQGLLRPATHDSEGVWMWTGEYDNRFGIVERISADETVF